MMTLRRLTVTGILILASVLVMAADNRGLLGKSSTGHINLSLSITEDIRAGLLRRDRKTESDIKTLISSGLVQGLQSGERATLSLCIMSAGGGSFEVTSMELPGQSSAWSQFGEAVPMLIGFGADARDSVKHRASEDGCTQNSVVPVTIELNEASGTVVGKIHGSLTLLVKSE